MAKNINLDRDKLDFGVGKIGHLFRALFFPTLIGMIFNSVLTLIDGMFVGHGAGANGIAAVNIVAPIFMVTSGLGLMLGIGASVVASIRLSEDNIKVARMIMTQAFGAGTFGMGVIIAVIMLWTRRVVYALGGSPELEKNAIDYIFWLAPGMLFMLWQCIGMMLIRLDGSPQYAMWSQLIPSVINIVLDYIMIFPMGMGVKGAAIATSISCCIGGLIVLAYFIWLPDKLKFYRMKISVTSLMLTLQNIGYMAKIGFATFLTELAMGVMMVVGNFAFMKIYGVTGVAAYSIACYLFPVVFSIANAVAQSAQPIISYNYGSHQHKRVAQALKIAVFTAVICGITVSLGLWTGVKFIVGAFLDSSEPAFRLAIHGIPLFATCTVFFAINIAFIGYYQSIESALRSIFYTCLRGIVFLVPAFLLLPSLIGNDGPWLAIPTAEAFTLLIILIHYLISKRNQNVLQRCHMVSRQRG